MKKLWLSSGFALVLVLNACTNYFTWRKDYPADTSPSSGDSGTGTGSSVDTSVQTLCDIERSRTRVELLKRYSLAKFREYAVKVSKKITDEDVADLKLMEVSQRSNNNPSFEVGRRMGEIVNEIYTGAIIRAGFKPSSTGSVPGTSLSVTMGVDVVTSGTDTFIGFVQGHLVQDPGQEGMISGIEIGANADQSRYSVGLRKLTRIDTEPDGSQVPVYTTLSLFDASEETLPHYCFQQGSALNKNDFNTIPGLNSTDPMDFDPASAPSTLPSSEPSTQPSSQPPALPSSPPSSPTLPASGRPTPGSSSTPVPSATPWPSVTPTPSGRPET